MATTIDLLLSALHSHLTSQAPLIPALHAQLGLPQTALTDELTELHADLVLCVDKKIDYRRKEVEEWMNKCEHLERECAKFAKALGSNARNNVGEIKKQPVLPKRFEYFMSYQDKLHQLYQTKLEQLSSLTNRIKEFAPIVGAEFFDQEITLLASAPPAVLDTEEVQPLKDVTPEQFCRLEKELVRAKSEITRRLVQLSQTFLQIGLLHEELGMQLPMETEAESSMLVPASANTQQSTILRSCFSSLAVEPFMSASRPPTAFSFNTSGSPSITRDEDGLSSYLVAFNRFVVRLQEASDESLDLEGPGNETFGVENVVPTVGLMKWADATKNELEEVKVRRESHIQSLYNELDVLWRRLGIEEAEMDVFVEANRGSTEASVQAYEAEVERMLELKRESMSIFIANARAEIESLWDILILGDEERGSFAPFVDDVHTEELLTLHETEIHRLKEERRIKAPLLASIKKYFEICEEEKELAAAASDQTRLLGRGPRDPGRLLREEKMRKRVMKEKPRLEKDLLTAIPAWEDEYRRPFLINGVSIVEVLVETINAAENGKENRKRDYGGRAPSRGTTPQPGRMHKGATTPVSSLENTHGSQSAANKRPRLGNSVMNNVPRLNNVTPTYAHGPMSSSPPRPFGNKTNTPPRHRVPQHFGGTTKSGKTPTSSLPRAVSYTKPGYAQLHKSNVGWIAPNVPRIPSNTSNASNTTFSIFNTIGVGKKGSTRESFKPRPSVDDSVSCLGSSVNGGGGGVGRSWGGLMGRSLKEEDES